MLYLPVQNLPNRIGVWNSKEIKKSDMLLLLITRHYHQVLKTGVLARMYGLKILRETRIELRNILNEQRKINPRIMSLMLLVDGLLVLTC